MTAFTSTQVAHVLISEVGPRDGLQSVKATMPTADKLRWIDALVAAGLREIEVASFVPPRLLPQMADAADVVRETVARHPHVTVMALVPNLRGAEAAIAAGAHKLTLPVSASHAHSLANVRCTPDEMVQTLRAICRLRDERAANVAVEAGISTAFGCTLQGAVAEDEVIRIAVACAEAGASDVGLSDTTGMATRRRCGACSRGCGPNWASAPAPRTCTTRADWGWPIAWQRGTWACAPSTAAWLAWAAAPTHRAPRATW